MTIHYSSPALESELAYRREVLMASGRSSRSGRSRPGPWFRLRRRRR